MLFMVAEFSMLSSIIQFVLLLIVFLGILFAASWFTKWYAGSGMVRGKKGNIKVLESFPLGQGKVIQIVKIGETYLAIAQAKDTVTFLTELSEDELQYEPQNELKTGGFQEMFTQMLKNKQKQKEQEK